ncbi:MAG: phosphate acyltransferase, partial [Shewanella sp.]
MTSLTLALDAMGGDHGPHVTVPAALRALKLYPFLKIILVGAKTEIDVYLQQAEFTLLSRVEVLHTDEVVSMSDRPIHALRSRKNSSMRLAIELVRDERAAACVSAGNTGALMAMAKVLLKTLPGVDRPALVSCLPSVNQKPVYLLDLGANISCDSETLFQFAVMGSVLCEAVEKKSRPKVALLNVGTEEIKGNDQVQQAA